jgi:hypothetical protein
MGVDEGDDSAGELDAGRSPVAPDGATAVPGGRRIGRLSGGDERGEAKCKGYGDPSNE